MIDLMAKTDFYPIRHPLVTHRDAHIPRESGMPNFVTNTSICLTFFTFYHRRAGKLNIWTTSFSQVNTRPIWSWGQRQQFEAFLVCLFVVFRMSWFNFKDFALSSESPNAGWNWIYSLWFPFVKFSESTKHAYVIYGTYRTTYRV